MATPTPSGDRSSMSTMDKLKHPDLFPELRDKMKGSLALLHPLRTLFSLHTYAILQVPTFTRPKKASTISNPKSANSITSSIPITATTKNTSKKRTLNASALPNPTASSPLHQKERAIRLSGTSTAATTSGPSASRWRRQRRSSTSKTGG